MKKISIRKTVPVHANVEVLVVGGGPSGFAAAVRAGRLGADPMLVERFGFTGGMWTAGLVGPYFDGENKGGLNLELKNTLLKKHAWGGLWNICPDTAEMILVLDDKLREAKVRLLLYSLGTQPLMKNNIIEGVIVETKSGPLAIKAKIVIDCTGDGNLAVWAGAPFEKGDKNGNLMPGTLCSLWAGIDWGKVRKAKQEPEQVLLKVLKKYPKLFTKKDPHLPGILENGPSLGGGNVGHLFGVDGTDERTLTPLLLSGRKALIEYEYFYRKFMKGYEKATLVGTAPLTGIRETRRITGDYVLNYSDYVSRADFEDGIGRFNYWIDIHPSKASLDNHEELLKYRGTHYKDGESYGIPYRILTPLGLDNLLVAGRCVSVDQAVQSSIRVMPGCFITGQAAGMAAALAIEKKTVTRGIPVKELQKRLKKMGAFI